MSFFSVFAVLITVAALFSYLNHRFLKLPTTIGVMVAALTSSLLMLLLDWMGLGVLEWAKTLFETVDFNAVLMRGMLSFLLFAGAMHVDLGELLERKWSILVLATFGVLLCSFLVGTSVWFLLGLVGLEISYVYALLFGALISPTDPIAVLGILKQARAPRSLEVMITGESLFNDGVGVVVFTVILSFAVGGHDAGGLEAARLFAEEAIGGVLYGLGLGFVAYFLLKTLDDYKVEALITLAVVAGGYTLAGALHTSGPIAMVVAGLFIGNHGRVFAMSDRTRDRLDDLWELIDEVLNVLLFVMIGLEVLILDVTAPYLLAGLMAIPVVLLSRLISVAVPIAVLRLRRSFVPYTVTMMTWGGLRGGISIALALSLPATTERGLIVVATYTVVVFSILVQGLSMSRLARWAASRV